MAEDKPRREWGNGSFTTHVYAIEARAKHGAVILKVGEPPPWGGPVNPFASEVLTPHEWKRMHAHQSTVGVPNRLDLYPEARAKGFMTYQCAMALACWLQASNDAIETRLVQIEFKSSYSTNEIGVAPAMDLWEEDRQLLWHFRGDKGGKVRSVLPESPEAVAE